MDNQIPEVVAHTTEGVPVVDDFQVSAAADFLVAHNVPMVGPEVGERLLHIIRRLDVVSKVYPLSPTLEVYRVALRLVVNLAADHQKAFCDTMEDLLKDENAA
jgi:hypothetical protein